MVLLPRPGTTGTTNHTYLSYPVSPTPSLRLQKNNKHRRHHPDSSSLKSFSRQECPTTARGYCISLLRSFVASILRSGTDQILPSWPIDLPLMPALLWTYRADGSNPVIGSHSLSCYTNIDDETCDCDCFFLAQFHILSIGTRDVDHQCHPIIIPQQPKWQVVPAYPSRWLTACGFFLFLLSLARPWGPLPRHSYIIVQTHSM